MVKFNDFPQEVICAVLENLGKLSLTSTAIVATWLQDPSERLIYRTVSFTFPRTRGNELDPLQVFLQTTSLSDRRARYVDSLDLREFRRGEKISVTTPSLEKAMKNMVNLKKLSIAGSTYIRHAHLESASFSLTHLLLNLSFPQSIFDEYEILLPILKAHPELKALSLQEARLWTTKDDFSALEEQESDAGDHPSAVLCPRLEYFESNLKSLTESILAGRFIKHLILDTQGHVHPDDKGQWGPPFTFPRYRHLETLVLLIDMTPIPSDALPVLLAQHFTSLTRLNIHADMMVKVEDRPVVHNYTPDPLLLSLTQIQTLESLTLSAYGPWCTSPSEQEDMVRYLYKNLFKLKEAFVQSTSGHSHYGAKGELL